VSDAKFQVYETDSVAYEANTFVTALNWFAIEANSSVILAVSLEIE
jgi:hypothetical protein